jgi:hypothetical protein
MKAGFRSVILTASVIVLALPMTATAGEFGTSGCQRWKRSSALNWLKTPFALTLTLPGIALAGALYLGGQAYDRRSRG